MPKRVTMPSMKRLPPPWVSISMVAFLPNRALGSMLSLSLSISTSRLKSWLMFSWPRNSRKCSCSPNGVCMVTRRVIVRAALGAASLLLVSGDHRQADGHRAIKCRAGYIRSEEHTSELQSLTNLVCRLLLEKQKNKLIIHNVHTSNL